MLVLRIMIAILLSSLSIAFCVSIVKPDDGLFGFFFLAIMSLLFTITYFPLTLLLYNRINIKLFYLIIFVWSIIASFLFASYWFKESIMLVTISGIISSIVYSLTLYKTKKWGGEDGIKYYRTLFAWLLFFGGPGIIRFIDLLLVNKSMKSGTSDNIWVSIHFIFALIAIVYVYLDTKTLIYTRKRVGLVILQALIAFFAYMPVFSLYLIELGD